MTDPLPKRHRLSTERLLLWSLIQLCFVGVMLRLSFRYLEYDLWITRPEFGDFLVLVMCFVLFFLNRRKLEE